jgi:hypothetical protein
MNLRCCSGNEGYQAAQKYGVADEHEFKRHLLRGSPYSISNCDLYIDSKTGEVYIAEKGGKNPQYTGVRLWGG